MADGTPAPTELALLRSELLLPLTELRGDVRLILQRMDQGDARAAEHGTALAALDHRVDGIEQTAASRAELAAVEQRVRDWAEKEIAKARADAAEKRAEDQKRADRRLTIVAISLSTVIGVLAVAVAVIGIISK